MSQVDTVLFKVVFKITIFDKKICVSIWIRIRVETKAFFHFRRKIDLAKFSFREIFIFPKIRSNIFIITKKFSKSPSTFCFCENNSDFFPLQKQLAFLSCREILVNKQQRKQIFSRNLAKSHVIKRFSHVAEKCCLFWKKFKAKSIFVNFRHFRKCSQGIFAKMRERFPRKWKPCFQRICIWG